MATDIPTPKTDAAAVYSATNGEFVLASFAREQERTIAELVEALTSISTNKHLDLGDLVYQIRERELQGWEGPAVKAWSDAVMKVRRALAKAGAK